MNTRQLFSQLHLGAVCSLLMAPCELRANTFVSGDNAGRIEEPAQRALILFDQGREDLVLQAKCKGDAQPFGWLIPVPGTPEVKKGSIKSFQNLSRVTGEAIWPEEFDWESLTSSLWVQSRIKDVQIQTISEYEIEVFGPEQAGAFSQWLAIHGFILPKNKQTVVDKYFKDQWHLVAVKINPGLNSSISSGAELQPLVINFASQKCVYPLALSAADREPAEVSIFALSGEPLMSPVIFEKNFADYRNTQEEWRQGRPAREKAWYASTNVATIEARMNATSMGRSSPFDDPADPRPSPAVLAALHSTSGPLGAFAETDEEFRGGDNILKCLPVTAKDLADAAKDLPRLAEKTWWLTRQKALLAPEQMRDLEFEPALPGFVEKLHTPEGRTLAHWLPEFGAVAVPIVLANLNSSEVSERRLAVQAMDQMLDPRIPAALPALLDDPDARIRAAACYAARANWDSAFAPTVVRLLSDKEGRVRSAAYTCLLSHPAESTNYIPEYRRLLAESGLASLSAMQLLRFHGVKLSNAEIEPLLSSNDPCTVGMATWGRDPGVNDISRLLTNSLPMARLKGLIALLHIGDIAAMDRVVSMLRDPNEGIRWVVRQNLRRLTGLRLGSEAATWEKWWAENRESFAPKPVVPHTSQRKI